MQSSSTSCATHAIAPSRVIRGERAWSESLNLIPALTRRPALLGRSQATADLRNQLQSDLNTIGVNSIQVELEYHCCEHDLQRLQDTLNSHGCDGVIAAGGGKVLDAGKLLADRLKLSCITVPLSAATCAGWTALSNIYSTDGAFERDVALQRCPDLLVFDHSLVRQAPARTLASGIADALANGTKPPSAAEPATTGSFSRPCRWHACFAINCCWMPRRPWRIPKVKPGFAWLKPADSPLV